MRRKQFEDNPGVLPEDATKGDNNGNSLPEDATKDATWVDLCCYQHEPQMEEKNQNPLERGRN